MEPERDPHVHVPSRNEELEAGLNVMTISGQFALMRTLSRRDTYAIERRREVARVSVLSDTSRIISPYLNCRPQVDERIMVP